MGVFKKGLDGALMDETDPDEREIPTWVVHQDIHEDKLFKVMQTAMEGSYGGDFYQLQTKK